MKRKDTFIFATNWALSKKPGIFDISTFTNCKKLNSFGLDEIYELPLS